MFLLALGILLMILRGLLEVPLMWYQYQRPFKWLKQREIYHTRQDIGGMAVPKLAALEIRQHCQGALRPLPHPMVSRRYYLTNHQEQTMKGDGFLVAAHPLTGRIVTPVKCWTFTSHIFGITFDDYPLCPLIIALCVCIYQWVTDLGWLCDLYNQISPIISLLFETSLE